MIGEMNIPTASSGVSLRSAHTRCGSAPLNSALRTPYLETPQAAGDSTRRTPQKLGLSDRIGSNTKSVDYRLHIRRGSHAKGGINNQFLITGFSRITKKLV